MNNLKILFIGDISGRPGRETVREVLPKVKNKYSPDLVIANCENSAGGVGVTRETLQELISYGVDFFTGGDHVFRFKEFVIDLNDNSLPIIIPANITAEDVPGKRFEIVDLGSKGRVGIINLLGMDLMPSHVRVDNPFWYIKRFFDGALPYSTPKRSDADIWIVDYHAETTSEKLSFAWSQRDNVSALLGTHTHVATADNRLLGGKIAYVTDVGQVGPYTASLWVSFDSTIHNFMYPTREPFEIEENGERIFNSVLIDFENNSPVSIQRVDIQI